MTLSALFSALLAVCAWLCIPVSDIGITMQTMFDKSVSKCAEIMINGVTMGIIDMKKAQRVCSENGCSPDAYRLAGDLISFCERYVERLKEFL